MYLYNISIIVEDNHNETLLNWLQTEWIPTINTDIKLLKMLNSPHEGHTFCVQMIVKNEDDINKFQQTKMADLQQHISANHHEKAFLFDSVMQYL